MVSPTRDHLNFAMKGEQINYRGCTITVWEDRTIESFPWDGSFVVNDISFEMRLLLDSVPRPLGTTVTTKKQCVELLRAAVDAHLQDKQRLLSRAKKYWSEIGYERGAVQTIIDMQDEMENLILAAWGSKAITEKKANELAKKFYLEWPED